MSIKISSYLFLMLILAIERSILYFRVFVSLAPHFVGDTVLSMPLPTIRNGDYSVFFVTAISFGNENCTVTHTAKHPRHNGDNQIAVEIIYRIRCGHVVERMDTVHTVNANGDWIQISQL